MVVKSLQKVDMFVSSSRDVLKVSMAVLHGAAPSADFRASVLPLNDAINVHNVVASLSLDEGPR